MKTWIEEVFGVKKPVIGMCHLLPLPGDPYYDKNGGMKNVIEWARKDLNALQNGGVDAVMFSNEFSMPYLTKVQTVTVASMAYIIGELIADIRVPFGVDVICDPIASLDLAAATGAKFVRGVFAGVFASDFGLWSPNCGEIVRHQRAIGAENVKLFFNLIPEGSRYLGNREVLDIVKSTAFHHRPDVICISGLTAGSPADTNILRKAKAVIHDIPVFANTGVCLENVEEQLSIADGAIVGTAFKRDGKFENRVDEKRVADFMDKVRSLRAEL